MLTPHPKRTRSCFGEIYVCIHTHTHTHIHTVGYATTNECYNEQILSIKSVCYEEHRCHNERLFIVFTKERLFVLFSFTCTVFTWIDHQLNAQFYLFYNNITSWSSTRFEHRCAHLQEDNLYIYSIWYRHTLCADIQCTDEERTQSALHRCTVRQHTECDDTRYCKYTNCPPEDEHSVARNMLRITM
jgi:hypothetical protein